MDGIDDATPGADKPGAAGDEIPTLTPANGLRQFEEAVVDLETLARSIKAVRRRAAFRIV